ncbi:hypothetical protein [Anoxynatronum sibiricum]|uniref:Uncharacterized protein n=1 Tax=Anoxynatronum sibiricum TaxID=210623 RepID=A0ABU9VPA3_9CLOT
MKVKTTYQGHVFELHRSLGSVSFLVDGEIRDMTGGKLMQHKVDQTYHAEIKQGPHQGVPVKAELKLGWLADRVFFYYNGQLIAEKKLF